MTKFTTDLSLRRLAILAAIGLVAVACTAGTREGQDAATPASETQAPAEESPVAQETFSGPFFLDLRTGEKTPLAENLVGGYRYAASPDGTRLAYGTCCSAADVLTVANVDGTNEHTLAPEGLNVYGHQWSPAGTKLVFQLRDGGADDASTGDVGNLFVHDLFTGRTTQLTDLTLSRAWWWYLAPRFSPDGRTVIFHLPGTQAETTKWDAWSVPVTGGEPTLVLRNAAFPMYFSDGTAIAFLVPTPSDFSGSSIEIAREEGEGSRRTLVEAGGPIWLPTMSPDGSRIAYNSGSSVYVIDVSTGESSRVADGETVDWLDDDTLLVNPG